MSDSESDGSWSEAALTVRTRQVTVEDPSDSGKKVYNLDMKLLKHYEYKQSAYQVQVDVRHAAKGGGTNPPPPKKQKNDGGDTDGEVVGYLRGNLLSRPSSIFFEVADAISGELQGLACLFCESDGRASRVKHPRLKDDSPEAVRGGGFLHIAFVEVRKQHRAKDLGLRMIHELVVFLGDLWTLAVMEVSSLNYNALRWKDNVRDSVTTADMMRERTEEEKEVSRQSSNKIRRHFGRMGFLQAGRSMGGCSSWFLTREMYSGDDSAVTDAAIGRWISRDNAETEVELYTPPPPRRLSPLDVELKQAVERAFRQGSDAVTIPAIEALVRRGASIDNSCTMHLAAANTRGDDVSLIAALVRLGGNVNAADDHGNSPLHVAAGTMRPTVVRYLIGSGADTSLTDESGDTPLDVLEMSIRNGKDFEKAMGMSKMFGMVKEVDVGPKLDTVVALMTSQQRAILIEGWMSPRMWYCLSITAELEVDSFKMKDGDLDFTPHQPTPLREVCSSFAFNRIDYIPMEVLQGDSRGIYKSFHDGYAMCFEAIDKILRRKQVPTIDRIRRELDENGELFDQRKLRHYLDKGGKIEFALDAVLNVTENVITQGDDGWEYGTFEEDIEAKPATPLDSMWDVARLMCLNRGGGMLDKRGPFRDVFMYGLEDE